METSLFFIGAMLFSCIFLLAPLFVAIKGKRMKEHGEYTDAVVVNTQSKYQGSIGGSPQLGGTSYHTTVKYSVDGREYVVRSYVGNPKPKHAEGEIVRIIYDRRNPEKIQIESDMATVRILSRVFLCVGIGLASLTIVLFLLLSW